ncbi:MAG TPA: chromosomal replication initiator protein DnaA [Thermopetrobacter sp.]|nr:chromosomal replication initiator protein DnaA [Thermopetrobacter sp.]
MTTGIKGEDVAQAWSRVMERLRAELGRDLYSSWFGRMRLEEVTPPRLTASVPTRFLKSWIETHYREVLERLCAEEMEGVRDVIVRVRDATRARPTPRRSAAAKGATSATDAPVLDGHGSPLDPQLTFETFVQGASNMLALAAARRVAEKPAGSPVQINPLFIHSAAGLGKTHLLNAIAWHIRRMQPGRSILYISAERFMYRFLAALKTRDMLAFKDIFQSVDVLLIDDFQFLQGKTMQQEFCHTFNSLVDAKRQVVIAADVPPSQLDKIDERMRSRLNGGLVVDIDRPDRELRLNILRRKLAQAREREASVQISEDVLQYIASVITGGGRELEGALNRVIATQHLVGGGAVSVDMAAQALKDLTGPADSQPVRIEDILRIVGRHYNVPKADLLSPRRARSIVLPRQIGMYLAKKLTSRSLPEIGRRFGGRDHSTVLHAVRKIERVIKEDEKLRRDVELLTRLIEQR